MSKNIFLNDKYLRLLNLFIVLFSWNFNFKFYKINLLFLYVLFFFFEIIVYCVKIFYLGLGYKYWKDYLFIIVFKLCFKVFRGDIVKRGFLG